MYVQAEPVKLKRKKNFKLFKCPKPAANPNPKATLRHCKEVSDLQFIDVNNSIPLSTVTKPSSLSAVSSSHSCSASGNGVSSSDPDSASETSHCDRDIGNTSYPDLASSKTTCSTDLSSSRHATCTGSSSGSGSSTVLGSVLSTTSSVTETETQNTDIISVASPLSKTVLRQCINVNSSTKIISIKDAAESDNSNEKTVLCLYCQKILKASNIVNHMKRVHNKTSKNTEKLKQKIKTPQPKIKVFGCELCQYTTTKEFNCTF